MNNKSIFSAIYHNNYWRDKESVSGAGSNMKSTEAVRRELPILCNKLGIDSILDIPCGDFYWMQHLNFNRQVEYIGADIVPELIRWNIDTYEQNGWRKFVTLDAVNDKLPAVDLILCRDMLGHLPNADVKKAIKNFRASGSLYLLATTFPDRENANLDIEAGQWRPINLNDWRFGLGKPISLINEESTEGNGEFADKSLGLWLLGEH